MSKIFVSCAAGTVGSALTAALTAASRDVVAGVHDPDKAEALKGTGADVRPMELEDPESLARAMDGCDKLFLLVPLHQRMTRWGHHLIDAAKNAGVDYIVRCSAYGAAADAHWRLGKEHGIVDQFVEDSGIPFTVLRPNSFMQNYLTVQAPSIRGGAIRMPIDESRVSFIDVRDVAACAASLFASPEGHEGRFYAVTGPAAMTQVEAAGIISDASGREVGFENIPEEAFVKMLEDLGVPEWNRNMLVSLTRIIKLGMMGNVTRAVGYFTGSPARSFKNFAAENAAAWK